MKLLLALMSSAPSMLQAPGNREGFGHPGRRTPWLRVLLALGFVLGCWVVDIHAIGHIGDTPGVDCEICLLAGGFDHAAAQSLDWHTHAALHIDEPVAHVPAFRPSPVTAFRSRAPPFLSNA